MTCLHCDQDLSATAARPAFDPWLGRLWRICPSCRRWNVVPLEDRWEVLEQLERAARAGRSRLRTAHLDLVAAPAGELVRVGRAPRPELAGWRYGEVLPVYRGRGWGAWLRRLLLGLPSAPFGYNAGYGAGMFEPVGARHWFASPFLDHAPALTAAFLHVPLAPSCPSCGQPLALAPWSFQAVRLTAGTSAPAVLARCAICGDNVAPSLAAARPALRLGLSIVTRQLREGALVEGSARELDRHDGPGPFVDALARGETALGDLPVHHRLALAFALDEEAEAELLEREWAEAEELAAIMDGDLTEVPAFDDFRRRIGR
jgi:hypothetical protein